jgi:hypothetical protein
MTITWANKDGPRRGKPRGIVALWPGFYLLTACLENTAYLSGITGDATHVILPESMPVLEVMALNIPVETRLSEKM